MAMEQILLVDDEPSILSVLNTLLKAEGYEVVSALGGEKARELMLSQHFDLMISDIRMAPVNGMELLTLAHAERPNMSVIMLTAYGSVETAIEALKLGAFDYITKPFKVDELLITIRRALEYNHALSENEDLKARLGTRYHLENIVAESKPMQNVCEMIRKVAPTDATVLIYGASGTGKELVAQAIHACSPRTKRAFLAVNCAALPEQLLGKLEASRVFQSGLQMVRQVEFSLFDWRIHSEYDPAKGPRFREILNEVRDRVSVLKPPQFSRFANSFSHVFGGGYAAGYYSYKWAEVLAADAFAAFEERGIFDRGVADSFRKNILEVGGTRDIGEAFKAFRGRAPRIEPLLTQAGIDTLPPNNS